MSGAIRLLALTAAAALAAAAAPALARSARPCPPVPNAAPEGPAAFIERLYRGYDDYDACTINYGDSIDPGLFAPDLEDLFRRVNAVELRADEPFGLLDDFDLFCECQDFGHVVAHARVLQAAGDKAQVAANLANLGDRKTLRFRLVRVAGSWRIGDVIGSDGKSLRREMIDYLKSRSAKPRR